MLGVVGHAVGIAVAPVREDLVAVGEMQVVQPIGGGVDAGLLHAPRAGRSARSGSSGESLLPVTDCQKPGWSARSSSSTCRSGVWITTSTDSGIL